MDQDVRRQVLAALHLYDEAFRPSPLLIVLAVMCLLTILVVAVLPGALWIPHPWIARAFIILAIAGLVVVARLFGRPRKGEIEETAAQLQAISSKKGITTEALLRIGKSIPDVMSPRLTGFLKLIDPNWDFDKAPPEQQDTPEKQLSDGAAVTARLLLSPFLHSPADLARICHLVTTLERNRYHDRDQSQCISMIQALGDFHPPAKCAVSLLRSVGDSGLRDSDMGHYGPDYPYRGAVDLALAKIGPILDASSIQCALEYNNGTWPFWHSAVAALHELPPNVTVTVVPRLIELLAKSRQAASNNSTDTRGFEEWARESSEIGSFDGTVRDLLLTLGSIAVPSLVKMLEDAKRAPEIRTEAAQWLPRLAATSTPDADAALKACAKCLNDADLRLRMEAAWSVWLFSHDGAAALPALIDAVRDPRLSKDALRYLRSMGAAARDAVPDLLRVVSERPVPHRDRGIPSEVEMAFEALGHIQPPTPDVLEVLTEVLKNDDDYALPAAKALGELGPVAQTALPLLWQRLEKYGQFGDLGVGYFKALDGIIDDPRAVVPARSLYTFLFDSGSNTSKDRTPKVLRLIRRTDTAAAVKGIVEVLEANRGQEEYARVLLRLLSRLGADAAAAVPAVTKLLDDPEESVCRQAQFTLRAIAPTRTEVENIITGHWMMIVEQGESVSALASALYPVDNTDEILSLIEAANQDIRNLNQLEERQQVQFPIFNYGKDERNFDLYRIQVGCFSSMSEARACLDKISHLDNRTSVVMGDLPDQEVQRQYGAVVGWFVRIDKAWDLLKVLKDKNFKDSRVIVV